MIIVRSPLRITLGGGGTDLPSYYKDHGGFLIAAAIRQYVYVSVAPSFSNEICLRYSSVERVKGVSQIRHPISREVLSLPGLAVGPVNITSFSDIPAGTGLGSSGSFTTALIRALYAYNQRSIPARRLAEMACRVEMEKLQQPVGKQDPYMAAYGGLLCLEFSKEGRVTVRPLKLSLKTLRGLRERLLLFFTGHVREAAGILKDQKSRCEKQDQRMLQNLDRIKELGVKSRKALESGDLGLLGALMHEHWEHKRCRSKGMSSSQLDQWYALALRNGAMGGKLVGAGGGGFLMFLAQDPRKLRRCMKSVGLGEVPCDFDLEGTKVLKT